MSDVRCQMSGCRLSGAGLELGLGMRGVRSDETPMNMR